MKVTKQQGFTLIELVIVIIILGILAVTAAPKFLNLQGDARASTIQGLRGALSGGANIVYSRAAINGEEGEGTADLVINEAGDTVSIAFGYPAQASFADTDELNLWVDLSANDWTVTTTGNGPVVITPASFTEANSGATAADQCRVEYTQAQNAGEAPTIDALVEGC